MPVLCLTEDPKPTERGKEFFLGFEVEGRLKNFFWLRFFPWNSLSIVLNPSRSVLGLVCAADLVKKMSKRMEKRNLHFSDYNNNNNNNNNIP